MEKQTHTLPAVVSLVIPGLGQMIKGHFLKGIAIWVSGGLVGFFLGWTVIAPLLLWVWNVYDAYTANS
jgi:TM2 domain-containing membrane protein YozV